ncbi:MAG: aldehyde dehydrogenase [Lachnospiraceae bacterium]|nr:aldehyde dehydrogenase [Lachnospiraceae bacterium]
MEKVNQEMVQDFLKDNKRFFEKGITKNISFRLKQLKKLESVFRSYETKFMHALYQDLGKGKFEAYTTEIGFIYKSIRHMIKNLQQWSKPEKVKTPVYLMPSKSYIIKEPYGTVLIIGPFNYPLQLIMEPLIGAIAAGNCAVIKPSENTPAVSSVFAEMIEKTFDKKYISVLQGGMETTSALINSPFDYIFFTGSPKVGKIVMAAAAKNLIPVTLELGGKSPVIVEKTANISLAAKRIVWGKFINTGQTCVAPDYILADSRIKNILIKEMKNTIVHFFGTDSLDNPDYGRIINERAFLRLASIIDMEKEHILYGGKYVKANLHIEPTLIEVNSLEAPVMADEIFGPLLPIMEYKHLDEAISIINSQTKPLAAYLFTENKVAEKHVLRHLSFGGGCINDTITHIANPNLPFGGIGNSGMGFYHGKYSFELFSHKKSILKKSTFIEMGMTFPPYGNKINLMRQILK